MNSRTRNVGTGSSEHDLVGDIIMMRRTAASVNGWNDNSDDDALVKTGGGGRTEVADRMSLLSTDDMTYYWPAPHHFCASGHFCCPKFISSLSRD